MSTHVTARISDDLVARVDAEAERERVSRSVMFGALVEEALGRRDVYDTERGHVKDRRAAV